MKKSLLATVIASFAMCSCGSDANFQGEVTGVESDTLLIYLSDISEGKWLGVDTVPLHNGTFEMNIPDSIALELSIAAKQPYHRQSPQILGDAFYFMPGDRMRIEGSVPGGLTASGTDLYDGLADYTDLAKIDAAMKELDRQQYELDEEKDEEKIDSIWDSYEKWEKKRNDLRMEIIREDPEDIVAAYLSLDLYPEQGVEAIGLLSDELRQGPFANLLNETLEEYSRQIEIKRVGESIQPGKPAPNFTLKDINGEPVTLEHYRGAYVVLDFWGTWCGWCLAGIPKMKECYAKFENNLEFIGICCFDNAEKWKKCVRKNEMNWVQVIDDEETDISLTYAISGYPTKIIVDPQGTIVDVFEGESPEFYDRLDDLFQR